MGFLNIKKKLLYIQTMGKNYQTKHYFLQALRDKGVDLLTEYKESVLKWSKNMAAKDRAEAVNIISQLPESDDKKSLMLSLDTWQGKTYHPICISWDCDGFNNKDLDDSPAPSQFWLYTIVILYEAGFKIDMAYSQYISYALDSKTIEDLNNKMFMGQPLPNIFKSENFTPIIYAEPDMQDDDIIKKLKDKNLEFITIDSISRPKEGAWSSNYGGEVKDSPGEKAGSFYAWHEYLVKHPEIEVTALYCWCNIAAGIADNIEFRGINDAHACMSSIANINRKEFGISNQVSILLIGDAKIAKSILVWKNLSLSRAYRSWREFMISEKKKYNYKQNSNINKILNSVDYNSDRSEDSDTERELYRYSINPNSLYMQ